MRRRIARLEIVGLAVAGLGTVGCGSEAPAEASEPVILLEGARLIVGDGSVIENGALLVREGRIAAVGGAGELSPPEESLEATRLDLSGRTVMPALVDAHAHLGYEGYTGWGGEHYSRENLIDHLHRYAYYGFGAVLSAGSDPEDLALELQRDQQAGEVGRARLLFAAGMAPPDQGPNDRFLVHTRAVSARSGEPVVRGLSSREDARREVVEVAEKGIPFVKIWVDDRGGSQEKLSPGIYRSVMAEARARGLEVLVHQQNAGDMPDLIRSGTDGFLHGRLGPGLDESVAALLSDEDVFLVPNLGLGELRRENVAADPFLREAIRPEVAERLDAERGAADGTVGTVGEPRDPDGPEAERGGRSPVTDRDRDLRAAFSRLMDAGVPIALGTDAGAIPDHFFGYTGHRELEIFVRLGMTPSEALVSATETAAAELGLTDLGTLEPGKSADFVVLEDDPTEDIRNTRSIVDVYLRGRRVNRDSLRAAWHGSPASTGAAPDASAGAPTDASTGVPAGGPAAGAATDALGED